jgi:hypothetical protein
MAAIGAHVVELAPQLAERRSAGILGESLNPPLTITCAPFMRLNERAHAHG